MKALIYAIKAIQTPRVLGKAQLPLTDWFFHAKLNAMQNSGIVRSVCHAAALP
jgi:hypothetical protein